MRAARASSDFCLCQGDDAICCILHVQRMKPQNGPKAFLLSGATYAEAAGLGLKHLHHSAAVVLGMLSAVCGHHAIRPAILEAATSSAIRLYTHTNEPQHVPFQ